MNGRVLFALLMSSLVATSANAQTSQMSDGEKKSSARAAYTEGVQLQEQGKPAEALAKFEAAQKFYDAPTHLLHIAECQAVLGKLVEASETYESLIRTPLKPDAPDVFTQAQQQAKAELPPLRQRIPTMRITVKPDPSTLQNLAIVMNDKQMPAELVGITRPVNPGRHRISASANGWSMREQMIVEVNEKETKTVELVLQQGGGPAVVAVPPPYGAPPGSASDPNAKPVPPEVDAPKPKGGPTTAGLLFGIHGGYYAPAGSVERNTDFDTRGSAGGGGGIDLMARFARLFVAGLRFDGIFLGGPHPSRIPTNEVRTSTTNMFGGAGAIGILSNVDKVSFHADMALGYRQLNYSQTQPRTLEASYSGSYFAIGAGISIPAGPIRLVPKFTLDLGRLSPNQGAEPTNAATNPTTTIGGLTTDRSAGYTMFSFSVGVFYSLDFGKKPAAAARSGSPSLL